MAGDRFGNLLQGLIRPSQVAVEGGLAPVQSDRPSNARDGLFMLPRLVRDHAQKMPRIGLIRPALRTCR